VEQRSVIGRVTVGAQPWAVAVADDGVVIVGHRLARRSEAVNSDGEAWLTVLTGAGANLTAREVSLASTAFGFPNALEALAVAGTDVYVAHLLASPAPPNAFNTSASGGLSGFSVTGAAAGASPAALLNLDVNAADFSTPTNFPRALAVSRTGAVVYLALAGTDAVMGVDVSVPATPRLIGFWPAGSNPRGLALSRDGATA